MTDDRRLSLDIALVEHQGEPKGRTDVERIVGFDQHAAPGEVFRFPVEEFPAGDGTDVDGDRQSKRHRPRNFDQAFEHDPQHRRGLFDG